MSLLHGVLNMGRKAAEARFTETFTFEREGTTPDENDVPVPSTTTLYAAIPGRVKSVSQVVSDRESGAQLVAVQDRAVHVAVGAIPDVRDGDFCRVTASTVDEGLVGRRFRVSGRPHVGAVTAARYPVTEAS